MGRLRVQEALAEIADHIRDEFNAEKRVLSYEEYVQLCANDWKLYARDAGQYLRDAFEHFGKSEVQRPWGKLTRFHLFDLPWLDATEARRESLVGQETIQAELYRILSNFTREGKVNKLPLLHGPNGSAKSTVARCIMLALEHYSKLAVGAVYRFHWVFPSRRTVRGAIGFGEKTAESLSTSSYAHLPDEEIDARLFDEIRDHPLLLIPKPERRRLLQTLAGEPKDLAVNHWLWHGDLSHKNRSVFDALLSSYKGSLADVLRHVQVERYFISRRYRTGAVTVGPELSVDARERQVTADRSFSALPSSLQAISLFEAHGELVEASGGLLEFSDLLKRPIDAFKYLQLTVESGEVSLSSQNVHVNCVMLASANEAELSAFRKHHEFDSFRGRVELIPAPYLRSWMDEQRIYDAQIAPQLETHVAPHAIRAAAMFAILTRLRKPDADRYAREVREIIRGLRVFEKMDLYATGDTPARLDADKAKLLRAIIPALYTETNDFVLYEGCVGASPREMRTVLLDAAQNPNYFGLSPFAVLDELDRLCAKEAEYLWLQQAPMEGGYYDHAEFRIVIKERLLDLIEDEFRIASNLVDDRSYATLFDRYIEHVNSWVKKERIRNPLTGTFEEPDERVMAEVEALLKAPDDVITLRNSWLSRIAAWAIEHPGEAIDNRVVFASSIRRLRDAVFAERRGALADLVRNVVIQVRDSGAQLTLKEQQDSERTLQRLCDEFGYHRSSASDAAAVLVRDRYKLSIG
jgi:serine protein kinase